MAIATCGGTSSPAARNASSRRARTGRRCEWAACRAMTSSSRCRPRASRLPSRAPELRVQRNALVENEAFAAEVRATGFLEILEDAALELPDVLQPRVAHVQR